MVDQLDQLEYFVVGFDHQLELEELWWALIISLSCRVVAFLATSRTTLRNSGILFAFVFFWCHSLYMNNDIYS